MATEQRAAVAATPPLGRGSGRVKLARTLLSLGLDQEALGVLRTAAAADPRLANDPDVIGLQAVASVLAFQPEEAAGLSDPRLTGSDEAALWRALRDAQTNAAPQQLAPVLATTVPLLLEAPTAIRRALLPLALETMIAGGEAKSAEPILAARSGDVNLGLARAMAEEAAGNKDAALAAYDAVAAGRDRLAHFRAAMRAVDLRLELGKLTPAQAAEALERIDTGWRGDRYELSRRERLAELRVAAGEWRAAFSGLREAEGLFPEASSELHARVQAAVDKLFAKDATRALPPLDFVALLNENADVLGAAVTRSELQQRLADRLLALDLPEAAVPLLRRAIAVEPEGAGRAATGAKLASLLLTGGDASGALAALDASKAPALPSELVTSRAVLSARATNARGHAKEAIAMLEGLSGDEPDAARADIAEQAGDYPTAIAALQAILGRAPPTEPITGETERTLLRLATDASRDGDKSLLVELRNHDLPKLGKDTDADTIRLLLAAPVQRMADLPRASKEAALAGMVAAGLRGTAPAH